MQKQHFPAHTISKTPVFLNRTIFHGLTVSKMVIVFVALLHVSPREPFSVKTCSFIPTRHRSKQNTASLGFASRFTAAEHHVNKPGRTARRPTSCTVYTRRKLLYVGRRQNWLRSRVYLKTPVFSYLYAESLGFTEVHFPTYYVHHSNKLRVTRSVSLRNSDLRMRV